MTAERPLFPGYLFCSFDLNRRLPILTTPGVLHILGLGKEPIAIDQREVDALWTTVRSGVVVSPWPFLRVGERVEVIRGPLTGVEGVVNQIKGACRLVVSVSLLQRSVAAEIEREWIQPVSRPKIFRNCLGFDIKEDAKLFTHS